jgi:GTP cyclohydrolase II
MTEVQTVSNSALFGSWRHTNVSRGLGEFHARRPVLITARDEAMLALPVEGLDRLRLAEFRALCGPIEPNLIITERRALALGLDASTPMALPLPTGADANTILALVTAATNDRNPAARPASPAAAAAIQLVKISQGLPAVLAANLAGHTIACEESIVRVEADGVANFAEHASRSLVVASEASVPLNSGTPTRFVVFHDAVGDDQIAVIVGTPDFTQPIPVRLHSACLTGDVFGSRRCDCGDQLRLALAQIEDIGGGVILYLAQEGRGLGLANKMRTYQLQDEGLDTFDANTTLGFDDDERDYRTAAHMLGMLNCTRIVLLTNNPAKLDGLSKAGIEIAGRMPLDAPINAHNRRYMTVKAARAEHQLDHLTASLAGRS